jgi:uncharacterized protein involved in outer membrane biogenesis
MKHLLRHLLSRKPVIIALAALLFYAVAGFFAVPWIARWSLPGLAERSLHCRAQVERIHLNPFLLRLEVDQFHLEQMDGAPLVAVDRLLVDVGLSSLIQRAVVLEQLEIDQPAIHLAMEVDGTLNLAQLAGPPASSPENAETDAAPFPLILRSAAVREGRITVVDKRQSSPAQLTLQGINLQGQELATVAEHGGTYALAVATEAGESIQARGDLTLFPLRSQGSLQLSALRLASLWQFLRDSTNLEPPAGQCNLATTYRIGSATNLTLEELRFSLADLALQLHQTDSPLVQLKTIELEAPRVDLGTKAVQVSRLLVADGRVDARISDAGVLNLEQIGRPASPERTRTKGPAASVVPAAATATAQVEQKPAPAEEAPLQIRLDNIAVTNLALALDDRSRTLPLQAAVAGLDLHLQANVAVGTKNTAVDLQDIGSEIKGVQVRTPASKEPLFAVDKLVVEGGSCDSSAHTLSVSRVGLSKGRFDVGRDAQGNINWQQLVQSKTQQKSPLAGSAGSSGNASPWKFLIKSVDLAGFTSQFTDLTTGATAPVLRLKEINAKLAPVDGTSPMGVTLGFKVDQGGTLTLNGTVKPALPSLDAQINLAGLVLTSLQPYLDPLVTLKLQSAAVSAKGRLRYGIPGEKQQGAYEGAFTLANLRLVDAKAPKKTYVSWDSVHLPKCTLTLQPNRLDVPEMRIVNPVGELIIGEDKTLNLAKVLKQPPAKTKPRSAAPPAPRKGKQQKAIKKEPPQDVFSYRIGRMELERGDILFADLSLRPRFQTRIHDLKGSVTGLSSQPEASASMQISGSVDRYGMAKINGVFRPNSFTQASNIEMVFRNVEMKNLSPYSGKFAGRLIQSGKVSADLKYTLKDAKMTGDNRIVIDNLVLGDKVEDPEAANLPLDLAIALLKDGNGRIDIGLPVSGDLNDPQFSVGALVWKVLTNLITKTVTSPFRALGSLLGGASEDLDQLAFDPGASDLLPPEQEKLLKVVEALKSRPQLQLVLQGRYNTETDGVQLKKQSIRRAVAKRQGIKIKEETLAEPLDFSDGDTREALEEVYSDRFGKEALQELDKAVAAGTITPRPPEKEQAPQRDAGMLTRMVDNLKLYTLIPGGRSPEQAVLWAGELYARLVEGAPITDEALLQLAAHRAQKVAALAQQDGRIAKERISLQEAEPVPNGGQPSVRISLDVR